MSNRLASLGQAAATILMGVAAAHGAERTVLLEQITATWCGPCQSVGRAALNLIQDHPDSITGFQVHGSDSYTIAWGNTRMAFYNTAGSYPRVWLDGTREQAGNFGNDAANYANLQTLMNQCLDVPTDVTIATTGVEFETNEYRLTCSIGVETGGSARTMKFHCVQVLNYYPSGSHYYNCLIQANDAPTITVQPGETIDVEHIFTLSGASAEDKDNVAYIAWLQSTTAPAPSQVYNADFHQHIRIPPVSVTVPGDYPTISAAIENVSEYSTIGIAPGTYYERIDPQGKNVTLLGLGGAEATIIDGSGEGTVVTLLNGESSEMVLDGLTIRNGFNSLTGGIKIDGTPVIRNCIIRDQRANQLVSGISSASSPGPTISDTWFCNNEHSDIFGPYVDGGGLLFTDSCDATPPCPGDFDGNAAINVNDLLTVIQEWNDPYTVDDLLAVIAHWGGTCP